jgi:hypothetical protein
MENDKPVSKTISSQSFDVLDTPSTPTTPQTMISVDSKMLDSILNQIEKDKDTNDNYQNTSTDNNDNYQNTDINNDNNNQSMNTIDDDSDDEIPKLDDELIEHSSDVPHNTPDTTSIEENYETKKKQVTMNIEMLKDPKQNISSHTRQDMRALKRHFERLVYAEKQNVSYDEFKSKIIESYKLDKNMSKLLRSLYL